VKKAGYSMDDLEPVFTVSNTYFYIAISIGTPVEIVKKWHSVLDGMKRTAHSKRYTGATYRLQI
jgi:polar amino acid transport system substrate-binding protein